ncbi:VOC family protein [Brevundimonas subvibrioides]|uniref:VOC family protein n=1 Tax=Brevundimonas subvibrioides TaxID=74313 RepID=UPI0022B46EEC|nr:VOC family protein [Brevundimonas subvibrioides]
MSAPYVPPDPPVVPYLVVHDGPTALDWYVRAFAATVILRYDEPDGRLGHAALSINGGTIYLADEFPELHDRIGTRSPHHLNGSSCNIALAVDDVDAWMARAAKEGAITVRPATDDFYGRHGKMSDPFGHVWSFLGPKTGL